MCVDSVLASYQLNWTASGGIFFVKVPDSLLVSFVLNFYQKADGVSRNIVLLHMCYYYFFFSIRACFVVFLDVFSMSCISCRLHATFAVVT